MDVIILIKLTKCGNISKEVPLNNAENFSDNLDFNYDSQNFVKKILFFY
jgi:hypothetical protein